MAKVDIKMPEEFLQRISRLGSDFDPVAEKVLEAGGEIVLAKAQSNLSSVVGNGTKYESRSTGELESALGLSTVKMDKNGNHNIKVGFAEPRRWCQQCETGQHHRIRQTRSACQTFYETCKNGIPCCLYQCHAG